MPTLLQKTVSFLRAVTSGRDKKLQAERDAICDGCDQYTERPTKSILGKWKMQGFCKACGCGARSMADMKGGKNAFVNMTCPLAKWPGDAESLGLTLKEVNTLFGARDRLEYNMALVQNNIDKQKPLDPAVQASIFGQPQPGIQPQPGAQQPEKARPGAVAVPRPQSPQTAKPMGATADQIKQTFPTAAKALPANTPNN